MLSISKIQIHYVNSSKITLDSASKVWLMFIKMLTKLFVIENSGSITTKVIGNPSFTAEKVHSFFLLKKTERETHTHYTQI